MSKPARYSGVSEYVRHQCEVDRQVEEIKLRGYTVLPNVIQPDELPSARKKMDELYERQAREFGGEEKLKAIDDVNKIRCLLAYDDLFLHVSVRHPLFALLTAMMGDYFQIVSQNGTINVPGAKEDRIDHGWHRDLTFQHFVCTRPILLTALFCVDPFTKDSGATWVCPGSHLVEACPSEEYLKANETQIEAEAGSVIVLDAMLFHRSGTNLSIPRRRAFTTMYGLAFVKQIVSLPIALKGRHSDDPMLRRVCGYDSAPVGTVLEWRNRAHDRVTSTDPNVHSLLPKLVSRNKKKKT